MTQTIENLSLRAEAIIREGIIRGDYAFGERLSDRILAASLGNQQNPGARGIGAACQRTPRHDPTAERQFCYDAPHRECAVDLPNAPILECGALRLAAASDPDRLAAAVSVPLAGAALALEDGDLSRAGAMNSAFHEALVIAADNSLLSRAYRGIADQIEAMRNRLPKDLERMKRAVVQHRRIIDLALTGRMQEAEAELGTHVQIVQGLTVSMLSEGDRS